MFIFTYPDDYEKQNGNDIQSTSTGMKMVINMPKVNFNKQKYKAHHDMINQTKYRNQFFF